MIRAVDHRNANNSNSNQKKKNPEANENSGRGGRGRWGGGGRRMYKDEVCDRFQEMKSHLDGGKGENQAISF